MIEVKEVYKYFGEVKAVDGVDFKIKEGTFLGLLGPNGAGKSTLIKTIIGLLKSDKGQIIIDNELLTMDSNHIKKNFGVVTQHMNLDKDLTVYENLIFTGKLYKMNKKYIGDHANQLIDIFKLDKVRNRLSSKLSGGMKRKLMIAKALMHRPKYIIMDEPTVGIDLNSRKEIWDLLKMMNKDGKTIILTTHYIEEAETLCNRVMLMDQGKIFDDDSSQNLINKIGLYTLEYFDNNNQTIYRYFKDITMAKDYTNKLNTAYSVRQTTLEDVFYSFANKKVI